MQDQHIFLGIYIPVDTLCFPRRSRVLIRAECCWIKLFMLLIKIIIVVFSFSVNRYIIPYFYVDLWKSGESKSSNLFRGFFHVLRDKLDKLVRQCQAI